MGSTGNARPSVVLHLVTGPTGQSRGTVSIVAALDTKSMEVAVFSLAGLIAGRVAIQAPLVGENLHHLVVGHRGFGVRVRRRLWRSGQWEAATQKEDGENSPKNTS